MTTSTDDTQATKLTVIRLQTGYATGVREQAIAASARDRDAAREHMGRSISPTPAADCCDLVWATHERLERAWCDIWNSLFAPGE